MRLPRLSEGVVRRNSGLVGRARGAVGPLATDPGPCVKKSCTSSSDCADDPACPHCTNGECSASQDDACR
jgi:hypothetical protein